MSSQCGQRVRFPTSSRIHSCFSILCHEIMKISGLRLMNIEKDILRLMNIEEDILQLMNIEEDVLRLMNIEEEDIWAKVGGYHRVWGQESQMRKSENVFQRNPFSRNLPLPPCPSWLIILSAYWMINWPWWPIRQSWAPLWWSSRWRGSVWSAEPPFFKSETHQVQNQSQFHSQLYKPSIITLWLNR